MHKLDLKIRPTRRADIQAVDLLLASSYKVLLKPDYKPSVMVTALPIISKAQPRLVTSGTYFGVFDGDQLVGAGGWSRAMPDKSAQHTGVAHIRHIVTDHRRTRQGIGQSLMVHILADAKANGARYIHCQSTLTAVPFYRSMGFRVIRPIIVPLRPGIDFPAISMEYENELSTDC